MGCTAEVNFGKMRGSLQLLTVNEAGLFFGYFWFVYLPFACLLFIFIAVYQR